MTDLTLLRRLALCALAAATTGCSSAMTPTSAAARADSSLLRRDIEYLASDRLEGRLTGTAGNDSAAAYIARRFASVGLKQLTPGYLQPFEARSAQDAHLGNTEPRRTQNVVALLPGRDPALRGEYIVIGAHHDHLGRSTMSALDPGEQDAIRNGADDNASGTAAVLELARLLAANPPRRSVIFATFSGEEQGLLGSQWFVDHPPVPLDRIVAMLNFDMVGRLKDDKLMVYGTATAAEFSALLDSANAVGGMPLIVTGGGDGFGSSDHSSFYGKNIPVLHFFTDLHSDYHRATDDVEKINASGETRVVDLAHRVARGIGQRQQRLTFVRATRPTRIAGAPRQGSQAYLGSIPDMAASETPGLKLTGVRAGSPADVGGLKPGDIIVEFAGKEVKDLYSYSDALYSYKPGDTVKIAYLRDGKRSETSVTLGKRGG